MGKKSIKLTVDAAREALENHACLSNRELEDVLDSLQAVSSQASPWWVVVLKILAYAIGLLLAGYGTSAAAQTLNVF